MALREPRNVVGGAPVVTIGADLGFTKDGVTITPAFEIFTPDSIEGVLVPPFAELTAENYTIAFTLCEPTRDNIKIWADSTNTEGTASPVLLDIGHGSSGDTGALTERTIAIATVVPYEDTTAEGLTRTITASACVTESPGEWKISQTSEQSLPCSFRVLWDSTNARAFEVSDAQA